MMKYGIEEGQRYIQADGGREVLLVLDTETFAYCGDVVVRDKAGEERRIDAFKLARVRYMLQEDGHTNEEI